MVARFVEILCVTRREISYNVVLLRRLIGPWHGALNAIFKRVNKILKVYIGQ
jgi:hypothetical protein